MFSKSGTILAAALVAIGINGSAQAQGVDNGPYLRFEIGSAFDAGGDAYWQSPGFPRDPQVFFDLSRDDRFFASAAVGQAWSSQLRGDISISFFGDRDFAGPWSKTVPVTAGPHADITGGSVRTTAVMANGYWSPMANNGALLQPFVTAGVGIASNRMSDWTRTNAAGPPRLNRTFEGDSNTDLAWAIGAGVTANLGKANASPILLEATYRYFDLGAAIGSGTPLPGNGASSPVTPLTYQNRDHVVSIGIRIPLGGK